MSKKYSTTTTLVIVESPAKCKKIETYLGPGYKVIASFGHLRTITGLESINIENNFYACRLKSSKVVAEMLIFKILSTSTLKEIQSEIKFYNESRLL